MSTKNQGNEVKATDDAMREYGVSEAELDRFTKRALEEIKKNREEGKLYKFTGDIEDLINR